MKFKDIKIGTVTSLKGQGDKRKLVQIKKNRWCWQRLDTGEVFENPFNPEDEWDLDYWLLDEVARVEQILKNYDVI